MSDALEQLKHELAAAQRALAEAEARFAREVTVATKSENTREQIERTHRQWMAALDAVAAPIFLHDKDFHILRCNQAYQRIAGVPFKQIIGQPYYEVYPKTHAPLPSCLRTLDGSVVGENEEEVLVGDTTYRSRAYSVTDEQGAYLYSVHILEDIAKRQQEVRALSESEMQYQRLFEAATDGILILDAETGEIVDANPFVLDLLSYSRDECIGKKVWEIGPLTDTLASKKVFQELQTKGTIRYNALPLETKDGRRIDVEFVGNVYDAGDRKMVQCNIRDITERKRDEENLRLFRTLLDNSSDAIEVLEPSTLRFLDVNETDCRLLGYSREEMLAMSAFDIDPAFDAKLAKATEERIRQEGRAHFETVHQRKDGSTFPVEVNATLVELDKPYLLSIARDITERKQAEAMLHESEERFRAIFEGALDGIALLDIESRRFVMANSALCHMLGYGPEEIARLSVSDIHPQRDWPYVFEQFDKQVRGEIQLAMDMPIKRKDSSVFYADINTSFVDLGGRHYFVGIFRDITERRQAEESLRRANRALKTLSAGNLALVRAKSEDELLHAVTGIIVEAGGYDLAAVDYAEDDPAKSLTPKAWSGAADGYFWEGHPSWADTEQGQLPIAMAIRSGTTQIRHDIASESVFIPWRDAALARGYVSNIALPLTGGGRTFGGLTIYSSDANAFDEEEIRLLEELANDLAYGIITLRARREQEQHAILLRQGLEQSIQTIADTLEARGPYTAGHQRRVAELATAIEREMGLPEEQVNGIHLAGIIHDLGKIHVPSEILSKPGKLTDIESMLVKTHPQAGYDILKDVKFPWPIADIILQHHEKLDGSGYPQGLMGDAILLESRIIAVADVVEAMSSHRPYRAGLGMEAALEEIERNRGVQYDPRVVDACIKLFHERDYKLPA